jgi:effector-binding domain-containing protein
MDKLPDVIRDRYSRLQAHLAQSRIQSEGGNITIFYGQPSPDFDLECAVPVPTWTKGSGEFKAGRIPAGRYITARYVGPYEGLQGAWEAFEKEMAGRGIDVRWEGWEQYERGPESESDPSRYETLLACKIG